MGAASSREQGAPSSGEEKMLQLDRSTLNKIESSRGPTTEEAKAEKGDGRAGSTVPVALSRQQYLDSSIQGKIREELGRLRKQEAEVQREIEQALEKENLDRTAGANGKGSASSSSSTGAKGKSSILLKQELDDVRANIERHQQRKAKIDKAPGVQQARSKLLECYNTHTGQTLECWAEVKTFKDAVSRAESDFVTSLAK